MTYLETTEPTTTDPSTKAEFLKWEPRQPVPYEFDGSRPVRARELSPRVHEIGWTLQMLLRAHLTGLDWRTHGPGDPGDFGKRVLRPHVFVSNTSIATSTGLPVPLAIFEIVPTKRRNKARYTRWRQYITSDHVQRCVLLAEEGSDCMVMTRVGQSEWQLRAASLDDELDLPELEISLPLRKIY